MAKNITASLPPKHGGYRAVQNTTSKGARTAPKPPSGQGGGSKGKK